MTRTGTGDRSFLAPPGEVADWRRVLLLDAAHACGIPACLPGTSDAVAASAGTDPHATRVLLEALQVHDLTTRGDDGTWSWLGSSDRGDAAVDRHHARAIRRWATGLEDRLRGLPPEPSEPPPLDVFLGALGHRARSRAHELADRCLAAAPGATRALDLGGGHGEFALALADRGLDVTLQDLPRVVEHLGGDPRLAAAGIALVPGDMHEVLPEGPFDLVLVAGVTHIFPGDALAALFARLRTRVPEHGVLAISTLLRGQPPVAPLFAVQMLLNGRGGDTHAEDEYRAWLAQAGFPDVVLEDLPGTGHSLLLAR